MKPQSRITLTVLSLFLIFNAQPVVGQTTFKIDPKTTTFIGNAVIECIYNYTVNAPLKDSLDKKKKETYKTILQANSSVSKYWDWHTFKRDSIILSSDTALSSNKLSRLKDIYLYLVRNLLTSEVIKNHPNGKITNKDVIVPDDYVYTEDKTDRNWRLKDDTMTVCGYKCNNATCSFGGRDWNVWFTPEIAISDGPWKLFGLPGLILKAEDLSGTHTFEAIIIRNSNRPIYFNKDVTQIKTTKGVFIKNKIIFEKDPVLNTPRSQIKDGFVLNGVFIINKKYPMVERQTIYCPLEFK